MDLDGLAFHTSCLRGVILYRQPSLRHLRTVCLRRHYYPLTHIMESKTQPIQPATGDAFSRQVRPPQMKRSHWIVFIVVCVLLGLLVFATIIHVINTNSGIARKVNAPAPVETVPVKRQTLDEVIGGSGA